MSKEILFEGQLMVQLCREWMVKQVKVVQCGMFTSEVNEDQPMAYQKHRQLTRIRTTSMIAIKPHQSNHLIETNLMRKRCSLNKIHSSLKNSDIWVDYRKLTTSKSYPTSNMNRMLFSRVFKKNSIKNSMKMISFKEGTLLFKKHKIVKQKWKKISRGWTMMLFKGK